MAIQQDDSDENESPGEFLYNTLQARVQRLGASAQMALALALRGGVGFRELPETQQQVFDQAAEDLEL